MARKNRGSFSKFMALVVLVLAVVGAYTIWSAKPTQEGVTAAKKTMSRMERAAKAAEKAW